MSPSTNSAEMTELCDDQNVSEDNEENLRFFGPKDNWYVNILNLQSIWEYLPNNVETSPNTKFEVDII